MKQHPGHSLEIRDEECLALKVTSGKESPYLVEWIKTFTAEDIDAPGQEPGLEPEKGSIPDITLPPDTTIQIMPIDEVSLVSVFLPEMNRKQTATALCGLIAREKGGQPEDWMVEFRISKTHTSQDADGRKRRVVGAAMEIASIQKYHDEAGKAGFAPSGALPGFLALDMLLRRNRPDLTDEGGWMLIFIGERDRFLCVGDDEDLLFSRTLPGDLSGGTELDEYAGKIVIEAERSVYFARQSENSTEIKRIIICGDPEYSDRILEKLGEIDDRAVVRWKPEELFSIVGGESPGLSKDELWKHTINLSIAVAALHGSSCNLLPDYIRGKAARPGLRYVAIAAAACFGAAVPILLAGSIWTAGIQQEFIRTASARENDLQGRVEDAASAYLRNKAMMTCQKNIERFGQGQPGLASAMRDIARRTPGNIVFENVKVADGENGFQEIILKGSSYAPNGEEAQKMFLRFMSALDDCPDLLKTKEPTYLEIGGVDDDDIVQARVAFMLQYHILEHVPGEDNLLKQNSPEGDNE